jgi:hypothetical protein
MKTTQIFLLFMLLACLKIGATPIISNVSHPNSVGRYEKFEIDFELNPYLNPYDFDEIDVWAEFTASSGKISKVFGFYFDEWLKIDDGAPTSDEILVPTGQYGWKIRFSPNETGAWTVRILATDHSSTVTFPLNGELHFEVTPTSEKGFISLANTRYLKYDSGDPFFPIGDSYPWWLVSPWRAHVDGKEKGTNIMKHYLDGMAANGFTYNRFEINFFEGLSLYGRDFVLQKTFFNYYNQHDAWQLDEIMEYAKLKEINFNLAIFSHTTLGDDGGYRYLGPNDPDGIPDIIPAENSEGKFILGNSYGNWSVFNPYNVSQDIRFRPDSPDQNGHSTDPYHFFSDSISIQHQKRLLRYIVARWGFSTNLMSFELIDEAESIITSNSNDLNINYTKPPIGWNSTYANWHAEIYDFLKAVDPNKHLVTSAVSMNAELEELVNPKMDFINLHRYIDYGMPNGGEDGFPFEFALRNEVTKLNDAYYKPIAIMETNWFASNEAQDPKLYELHNLIWSAIFNGSMGLTAIWAHEAEVLGRGAEGQFRGVSQFSKELPLFTEKNIPLFFSDSGLKCELLANFYSDDFFGRVQDEHFTFHAIWHRGMHHAYLNTFAFGERPIPKSSNRLTYIPIHRQGTYQVSWYNTQTGDLHGSSQVHSIDRTLPLLMPEELHNSTWADAGFIIKFVSGPPSLLVYPNPSDGIFNITVKHPTATTVKFQLFSNLGSTLLTGEALLDGDQAFSVDLSDYGSGVYHLIVTIDNASYSERLVRL